MTLQQGSEIRRATIIYTGVNPDWQECKVKPPNYHIQKFWITLPQFIERKEKEGSEERKVGNKEKQYPIGPCLFFPFNIFIFIYC